jgi:hypothetical protein
MVVAELAQEHLQLQLQELQTEVEELELQDTPAGLAVQLAFLVVQAL